MVRRSPSARRSPCKELLAYRPTPISGLARAIAATLLGAVQCGVGGWRRAGHGPTPTGHGPRSASASRAEPVSRYRLQCHTGKAGPVKGPAGGVLLTPFSPRAQNRVRGRGRAPPASCRRPAGVLRRKRREHGCAGCAGLSCRILLYCAPPRVYDPGNAGFSGRSWRRCVEW